MILNKGQKEIINEACKWYKQDSEQVFQYSGNAGTGKSLVLNNIIDRLKIDRNRVAPMSFIGAAAIVMRTKGLLNAKTIHSWLYRPVMDLNNDKYNGYLNRYEKKLVFEPKPLENIDLIVIDEAGSVPYSMKHEIESRGIKILACGDLDQLPPVMDKPAYLTTGKVLFLTEIMRQENGSNIPILAQRAKLGHSIQKGLFGDVMVIDSDELTDDMIMKYGNIVCGKNNTRKYYNDHIRQDIFGFKSDLPMYMDYMICRKNNWDLEVDGINLANGLLGHVINQPDVGSFNGTSFSINFKPIMIDSYFKDLKCDYDYFKGIDNGHNKYERLEKFEYAYAITTHLAQGSQFRTGIYIEEYLNSSINKNLNYTGITRFSNGMIYVRQKRRFY